MFKASVFIAGAVALANGQEIEEGGLIKSLFQEGAQDLGSKEWTRDTNKVFQLCDTNKSGQLSQQEYLSCGGNMQGWNILKRFDTNRDGLLSWSEAYNAVKTLDKKTELNLLNEETPVEAKVEEPVEASEKLEKVMSFFDTLQSEQSLYLDSKEKAQLDQIFKIADTDKDNRLSKAEIKQAALKAGEKINDGELDRAWSYIDLNKDGYVSYQELYNFIDAFNGKNVSLYTKTEKTNAIFQAYDSNRDGFLTFYEVKRILQDAYGYATDADTNWFIRLLDDNRDNKLSWYEIYSNIN
jgi:Ca2+-binding EF-hand superfamily protein